MSASGSQAHAFYREVAKGGMVYTVRDDQGYPAPLNSTGKRAMPFWSSRSRAEKIIATVPAYAEFQVEEVTWSELRDVWAPDLERDNMLIGVNWSGPKAKGYDRKPSDVVAAVEACVA